MKPFVIKKMRRNLRLTQKQLADITGSHSMTVWKWEKGILTPNGAPLILLRAVWKYKYTAISIIKNLRWETNQRA